MCASQLNPLFAASDQGGDMRIEFDLTPEDFFHFADHHISHSPTMRKIDWFFMTVPTTAIFLGFVYVARSKPLHGVLIGLFSAGLYLALGLLAGPRAVRSLIRRTFRDGPRPAELGHHVFEMSPDGLADRSEHGEMRIRWSGIGRVREDASYVYLYTQPDAALVVPKRAFAHPDDAVGFVAEARRRVEQGDAPDEAQS